MFFFAFLGLQVKLLLEKSNIENIVFFRSILGFLILFFLLFANNKKILHCFKTKNIKIHILRAIFGIFAMFYGYKSLMYLSLAQASTIGFSKVFFTCIFSALIFSEKFNLRTFFLIILGFVGIILIANPTQINSWVGLSMSIFSAICVSGGIISISYLSKKDKTTTILFYHSLISTIIFFIIFKKEISFELNQNLFRFFLLTVTALLGQYFNTESYKNSVTKNVVILSYSRIVFSAIFGFIFFNEEMSILNILGIITVILSSFLVQKK